MSDTDYRPIGQDGSDVFTNARRNGPDDTNGLSRAVSGKPRIPLRAIPAWDDGGAETSDGTHIGEGSVPRGGRGTSGGGGADGDPLRPARGRGDHQGPRFDLDVPPNGYAWWYIDGISDDGKRAVSVIAFIGSVFSPWYKWSGRKDPENHVCINVATYGPGGRFTMTDRGRSALRQTEDTFTVGPSSLHWDGTDLIIDIDEISALPIISRVRGQIRLTPKAMTSKELLLTRDGAHYFDSNFGTRALEEDFSFWTWGRYPTSKGAVCIYDAERRDGTTLDSAIAFTPDGSMEYTDAPPRTAFKRSLWQVRRETRADPGTTPRQVLPMLDAPFYSRSAVETTLNGERVTGVHEALDLNRFASPFLKPMLAVRVPRRAKWTF